MTRAIAMSLLVSAIGTSALDGYSRACWGQADDRFETDLAAVQDAYAERRRIVQKRLESLRDAEVGGDSFVDRQQDLESFREHGFVAARSPVFPELSSTLRIARDRYQKDLQNLAQRHPERHEDVMNLIQACRAEERYDVSGTWSVHYPGDPARTLYRFDDDGEKVHITAAGPPEAVREKSVGTLAWNADHTAFSGKFSESHRVRGELKAITQPISFKVLDPSTLECNDVRVVQYEPLRVSGIKIRYHKQAAN